MPTSSAHGSGVKLEGAFAEGATVRGKITSSGYEHVTMEIARRAHRARALLRVSLAPVRDRPEGRLLARADDARRVPARGRRGGTVLTIVESGFDRIPLARRAEAFRMNDEGGPAAEEHRAPCRAAVSAAAARAVRREMRRRCSRRSATRRASGSSRACASMGRCSIARLSEGAGVTRQAVTKHLHALAEAGLVRGHLRAAASGSGSSSRSGSSRRAAASIRSPATGTPHQPFEGLRRGGRIVNAKCPAFTISRRWRAPTGRAAERRSRP